MNNLKNYKIPGSGFNNELYQALNNAKDDFEKLNKCSGNHVIFEDECGYIYDAATLGNTTYMSITSTPIYSIIETLLEIARTGLSICPAAQLAYLHVEPISSTQLITKLGYQYRGFLALANRSGVIAFIHADIIYTKDEFSFNGQREKVTHRVKSLSPSLRGEFGGGYCTSELIDGSIITTTMTPEEILAIEYEAKTYQSSAWNGPFVDELRRKTLIRRHWKTLSRVLDAMNKNNEKTVTSNLVDIDNTVKQTIKHKESLQKVQAWY